VSTSKVINTVTLPDPSDLKLTAPDGKGFSCWRDTTTKKTYAPGDEVTLTAATTFEAEWAPITSIIYPVYIEQAANGTITANVTGAKMGDTVTLTVKPADGYELSALTIGTTTGETVTATKAADGTYTLKMPAAGLNIEGVFVAAGSSDNQKPDNNQGNDNTQPPDGNQGGNDNTQPPDGNQGGNDNTQPPDNNQGGGENPIETPDVNPPETPKVEFSDVDLSKWYGEYITYVVQNGIMQGMGDGTFAPDTDLTRAQLAQILYNIAGQPEVTSASPFADVAAGKWYTAAITWAAENGVVKGYGDGNFGPEDKLTREQLATMLWRYAGEPASEGKLADFTDAASISAYAVDALKWATEVGIVNGMGDGTIAPQGLATRAQVAKMITVYQKG
jgi:hypothetical protein